MNLDSRLLTVVLPFEVRPGDRVLIQAPAPPLVLKRATAAPIAPCTKREGYVTCARCSYDNSVALLACEMCGETISLTHEALREQVSERWVMLSQHMLMVDSLIILTTIVMTSSVCLSICHLSAYSNTNLT